MSVRPFAAILCLFLSLPPAAGAFETRAREALAVDHATGMVLFAKDADVPMPPASMSKLMTLYMLFEALRDGKVTLATEFEVSPRAQAMGGSRMFAEAGTKVPVEALIHGIITLSGNDACVVVAEGLAGTEDAFARAMTERAAALGLTETHLMNASGWPADGHVMSARDLVTLARRIITEFPQFYPFFAETEYTWNGITQPNRNPLLKQGIGADGLKTGHTSEAGYGLVGSTVQDGQRIVFVLSGLSSAQERAEEAAALVKWAYASFDTVKFFGAGDMAAEVPVWLGASPTVPMVAPGPVQMLVPHASRDQLTARVVYAGPVEAPISKGMPIGALVVEAPDIEPVRFDLVAGADVGRGGLMTRINAAAQLTRDRALGLIPGRD